jgi:hypothetical protein
VKQVVNFKGKSLNLSITRAAERMLEMRSGPLQLELELYFSCLVRKRVHVHENGVMIPMRPVSMNG